MSIPKPPTKFEYYLELILKHLHGLEEKMEKIEKFFEDIPDEETLSEKTENGEEDTESYEEVE